MTRDSQEDAYRFTRGEEVTTYGRRAKLSRPLDFLVISDQAEMYGLMQQLLSSDRDVFSKGRSGVVFGLDGGRPAARLRCGDANRGVAVCPRALSQPIELSGIPMGGQI